MNRFRLLFPLLLAFSATLPFKGTTQPVSQLHFSFNNTTREVSGLAQNGKYVGQVEPAPDRYGNSCGALRLHGGSHIQYTESQLPVFAASGFTICAWVYPEKNEQNDIRIPLLSNTSPDFSQKGLTITYKQAFWEGSSSVTIGNQILEDKKYQQHRMDFNRWYFLTLKLEDTWAYLYLDGKLIWQSVFNGSLSSKGDVWLVGRDIINDKNIFTGRIDDLRLFNRALNNAEISALFNDESGRNIPEIFTIQSAPDVTLYVATDQCEVSFNFTPPAVEISCGKYSLQQTAGGASGTLLQPGKHPYRFVAKNDAGKTVESGFTVTVLDTSSPVFYSPENIVLKAPANKDQAVIDYRIPEAKDNCGKVTVTQTKGSPPGSSFPIGSSSVSFTATDESGNQTTCTFTITVEENIVPDVVCNNNIVTYAIAQEPYRAVTYETPYVLVKGEKRFMNLRKGLASNSNFPVDETVVQYDVQTPEAGVLSCSFTVIVKDTTPPVIRCAENIFRKTDLGKKSVAVNYTMPTATDAGMPASVRLLKGKKSGDFFAVGNHEIIFEAADKHGNKAQCNLTITVEYGGDLPVPVKPEPQPKPAPATTQKETEPKTKPTPSTTTNVTKTVTPKPEPTPQPKPEPPAPKPLLVECPQNITINTDAKQCGARVQYSVPRWTGGVNPKMELISSKPSGSFFDIGRHEVAYKITDGDSVSFTCSFTITVVDNEVPAFNCPADSTVLLTGGRRGIMFYFDEVTAADNCTLDTIMQTAGAKSGCFLPIGEHLFAYTASDIYGNTDSCGFVVTVMSDNSPPQVKAPNKIDKALNLGNDAIKYEHKVAVDNCFLTIYIYDDSEEDGDSVSIVFNGQVIVNRQEIKNKENGYFKRTIMLGANMQNYLVAKAWNTGRYGLNTLKIDIYEGHIENDKKELRNKKPVISKVMHSKPGNASGMLLKCSW